MTRDVLSCRHGIPNCDTCPREPEGARVYVLERLAQYQGQYLPGLWELVSIHWEEREAEARVPRLLDIENCLRRSAGMREIDPREFRVRKEPVKP